MLSVRWVGVKGAELWSEEVVIRILRDERYLGKTIYGKRYRPQVGNRRTLKNSRTDWIVVEGRHEPLVSVAEFQRAQEHLAEYAERDAGQAGVYLFTDKLRCGHCGYSLIRRSRSKPDYYCRTRYYAAGFGCVDGSVQENEIASIVLTAIQAYIQTLMDEKELLLKAGNNDILVSLQKQVTAYQGACAKIDEQKAELYEAMAEDKISREKYQREREKLSREQEDMARRAETAEAELTELRGKMDAANQGETKLMRYLQADTLTRQMVVDFVDCVYVYNDKSIHIKWTFSEKGAKHESA